MIHMKRRSGHLLLQDPTVFTAISGSLGGTILRVAASITRGRWSGGYVKSFSKHRNKLKGLHIGFVLSTLVD